MGAHPPVVHLNELDAAVATRGQEARVRAVHQVTQLAAVEGQKTQKWRQHETNELEIRTGVLYTVSCVSSHLVANVAGGMGFQCMYVPVEARAELLPPDLVRARADHHHVAQTEARHDVSAQNKGTGGPIRRDGLERSRWHD